MGKAEIWNFSTSLQLDISERSDFPQLASHVEM